MMTKKVMIFVLVLAFVFAGAFSALGEEMMEEEMMAIYEHGEPQAEEMLVDIVLVRPLGLLSTVAGAVFFVASLPFSVPGGNAGDAAKKLVAEPATFTFNRPIGDLEY